MVTCAEACNGGVGYNQTLVYHVVGARTVEWESLIEDVFDHGSCCVTAFLRVE